MLIMTSATPKYAEADYARAFELDSNNATYVLGWSDCLFDMNEVSKAVEMLENYQLRIPGNPDIMFSLAVDYFLLPQPKYPQSIDLLNEILKQDIQNAPAYFTRGWFSRNGRHHQSHLQFPDLHGG